MRFLKNRNPSSRYGGKIMDIKEAYQEIKYFKELYRDISKLGKGICINGKIYFIEADGREFFEVSGTIHDVSHFSHFILTHICEIDNEKIKLLKNVKKKEVIENLGGKIII